MANPSIQLGTNSNWAVKEDKLLAYKEYNDYFFNKEFDFSRGTSATYVAKDGLIKTAGIQPNIVNNGDFSELGSELVTNGDFATDSNWIKGSGWSISNGVASYDGGSGTQPIRQSGIAQSGKTYKISLNVVSNEGSGSNTMYLGGVILNTSHLQAGSYTFFVTTNTTGDLQFFGRSGENFVIDNVSVKQVDPNNYWTLGTGWSVGDNKATSDASANSYLNQQAYEIGKTYKLGFEVLEGTIELRSAQYSKGTGFYTTGTHSIEVIPTTTSTHFYVYTGFGQSSITNITVQEIQTDTPRIDFTNDTKGHLLLEPSRTNIITSSSNFSAASWQKVSATLTSVNIPLPDGTTGGFQITQNGGASDRIQDSLGFKSNNHFFSLFVKGTSYASDFIFRIRSLRGEDAKFNMNTNNEISYNSGTSANYFIEEYENGWYRVGFESTMSNTQSNYFQIFPDTTTDSFGSIYIWGAQVEEGSYPTSYIPTTGAISTRNADVCNNSGSAQDFNDSEGVLYAEIAALENDGTFRQLTISDSSTSDRVSIDFTSTDNQIRSFSSSGGSTAANMTGTVTDSKEFNKVAVKYKLNDYALWINGNEVSTDTSAAAPVGLQELGFDNGGGSNDFYGKVRNLQVFTEALTDAELQELTS